MPRFARIQPNTSTHIVLAGGGHAHVHVLKAFAGEPEPAVRITLISRDSVMLYSGMVPGVIAGLYCRDEAEIDLRQLAEDTGAAFLEAEVAGIDRLGKHLLLSDGRAIRYDLLSLDIGITPELSHIDGAAEHAIAVKPISRFLQKLDGLLARCRLPDGPRRITVIGGGAGGVELLLSLRTRIRDQARTEGSDADAFAFALVTEQEILTTHNPRVRSAFRRLLKARGLHLEEHSRVARVRPGSVVMNGGAEISSDEVLVTTGAAAPPWFPATGLALDASGFLSVAASLQVVNDQDVFAVGDCATSIDSPREKAGVFAVRAGPPLVRNLRRRSRGETLRDWRPQQRHLAIISTGERYAVASRGVWKLEGAWLWSVKNWIDRRWIQQFPRRQRRTPGTPGTPAS
jgi:selenide,water dikinase